MNYNEYFYQHDKTTPEIQSTYMAAYKVKQY